jgi:hypothetical protein
MSKKLTQVWPKICVVCASVANCGVQAGKKFSTQNEESVCISIRIILPVYLRIHHVE